MKDKRSQKSGGPKASARVWMKVCYCALLGVGLMSVALLVHPMNPEDFLYLVFSDPLATVLDAQGGDVALFFWGSFFLCIFGCFAILIRHGLLQRWLPRMHPHAAMLRRA